MSCVAALQAAVWLELPRTQGVACRLSACRQVGIPTGYVVSALRAGFFGHEAKEQTQHWGFYGVLGGVSNVSPFVNELIGVWSTGAGYYDTMSDEVLTFKPDGTGRAESLVVSDSAGHDFRWQILAPGIVDLIGFRRRHLNGGQHETVVEADSGFQFTGVPFSVDEKERPHGTGQWMWVLQIGLPSPWPSTFGLLSREVR
jgi:hypothetical protein